MEKFKLSPAKLDGNLESTPEALPKPLSICIFSTEDRFVTSVSLLLGSDRYVVTLTNSSVKFLKFIEQESNIDCLLVQESSDLSSVLNALQSVGNLLPAVIVLNSKESYASEKEQIENNHLEKKAFLYHEAEVQLVDSELDRLEEEIDKAIAQFLQLSPSSTSIDSSTTESQEASGDRERNSLNRHQERLAEKLRERLGYLGVYYKRNPQNFLRNMPPGERQKLLEQLKARYRKIVLSYFSQNNTLNNQIDEFVNISFFADVPVTKIVEMHMDLMDEFSKQLKLEGRNEELLLDYRLTLIDTIAHLCEMYRRSVPKES